jgi:hypothetical protein
MMKMLAVSLAALLAVSVLPAAGSPLPSGHLAPRALPAPGGLVVKINGCHGDVRDAYIPEVGRRAPHYHLRGNCRPVLVEGERETRRRPVGGLPPRCPHPPGRRRRAQASPCRRRLPASRGEKLIRRELTTASNISRHRLPGDVCSIRSAGALVDDAEAGGIGLAGVREGPERAAALAADRTILPGAELLVAASAAVPAATATIAAPAIPAAVTATAAALAATDDAVAGCFGHAGIGEGLAVAAAPRADRVIFARAELLTWILGAAAAGRVRGRPRPPRRRPASATATTRLLLSAQRSLPKKPWK